MMIYSVSVTIDKEVEAEWLLWMRDHHVPDVMATGYFEEAHVERVMLDKEEDLNAKNIYEIRYHCTGVDKWGMYQQTDAPRLQAEHTERYAGKFSASRKLLLGMFDYDKEKGFLKGGREG